MTADPSAAADTLRDELLLDVDTHHAMVEALEEMRGTSIGTRVFYLPKWIQPVIAEVLLPVVRRYADARVAAERDARWRDLIAVRVNRGSEADPDWVAYHPHDVQLVYPAGGDAVTADPSAAADTLRDELTDALRGQAMTAQPLRSKPDEWHISGYEAAFVDAVLPVVRRYADAQVAAERDRIKADVTGLTFDQRCGQLFDAVLRVIARGQP